MFKQIISALLLNIIISYSYADEKPLILASTTSTENSGLLKHLTPIFTETTGIIVHTIALGTGQAIRVAQNGDADILMVHAKKSEIEFLEAGYGIDRREVMYNDFIIVGDKENPASINSDDTPLIALTKIKNNNSLFISRADDSGTHKRELWLWQLAKLDPDTFLTSWYRESGSGMGKTLNIAASLNAYTITDRGTWLSFNNRQDLTIANQGDIKLFNQYSIILVNPEKQPHVQYKKALQFSDWLISPVGQQAIADFTIKGEQLFIPNYKEAP